MPAPANAGATWPKKKNGFLRSLNHAAMLFWHERLKNTPRAVEFLESRGLPDPVLAMNRYKLGYAPGGRGEGSGFVEKTLKTGFGGVAGEDLVRALLASGLARETEDGKKVIDAFYGRLMFPISTWGTLERLADPHARIVGFGGRYVPRENASSDGPPKWLNTSETQIFSKRTVLYGWPWAMSSVTLSAQCIILEGYLDVIQAREAGFTNVVATLGTSLTDGHLAILPRSASKVPLTVFLCTDDDEAGRKAAFRGARILLRDRPDLAVRIARPSDGLDPDDLIRLRGPSAFQSVLETAVTPLVRYILDHSAATPRRDLATYVRVLRSAKSLLASHDAARGADLQFLEAWSRDAFQIVMPPARLRVALLPPAVKPSLQPSPEQSGGRS